MKVKIHFTKDGQEDEFIIHADDLFEIRYKARQELEKRGVDPGNAWSEIIE